MVMVLKLKGYIYIDIVYLELVFWLLKGSEDYCFKNEK